MGYSPRGLKESDMTERDENCGRELQIYSFSFSQNLIVLLLKKPGTSLRSQPHSVGSFFPFGE